MTVATHSSIQTGDTELDALLKAYGDACFDCGQWDEDNEDESYSEWLADANEAKRLLCEAIKSRLAK